MGKLSVVSNLIIHVSNLLTVMRVLFLFLLTLFLCANVKAQNARLDSLNAALSSTEDDSLKSEIYFYLSDEFKNIDINQAIDYISKSIDHARMADAPRLLAAGLNDIGIKYYTLGDFEKTLDYFYQVLAIYETIEDQNQLARVYNNVGLILLDLGRTEETVEYYNKSLAIKRSIQDTLGVANTLTNLGIVYLQLNKPDTAYLHFTQALAIDLVADTTSVGLFKDYSNIGDTYVLKKQYDSADFYYKKAMSLIDEVDEKYSKVELIEKVATLYKKQKKYELAREKYDLALVMAENIQSKQLIRNNALGLSEVYKALGNYSKSLEYYERYVNLQTELFNQEQAQKLAQIESSYQINQRENKIDILNKEAEIKDLKLSNSEMVIYWMGGILLLISVIIFMQVRKSNFKTRANALLRLQNEEIVEKNKNIMDSILCAKNIQQAILPDHSKLNDLFKEAFIYSKGRDVVSGDFYWFAEKNNKIFIAAVDCTGHGVPAAFLNVLANSLLNQIIQEYDVVEPSEILSELNKRMLHSLKSNNLGIQVDDGMDVGICMIDRESKNMSFAGAKRPLYFVHDKELKIIKGDHHAVGGELYEAEREYTNHHLNLKENDIIYLFTDGIVDQFGGESDKKFMYSRFKELLNKVVDQPLNEQKIKIDESLQKWKGNKEQTDDILLIGAKI